MIDPYDIMDITKVSLIFFIKISDTRKLTHYIIPTISLLLLFLFLVAL